MQEHKVWVELPPAEYEALMNIARSEYRHPRLQLRVLIREEAQRRGLLPTDRVELDGRSVNEQHATR